MPKFFRTWLYKNDYQKICVELAIQSMSHLLDTYFVSTRLLGFLSHFKGDVP